MKNKKKWLYQSGYCKKNLLNVKLQKITNSKLLKQRALENKKLDDKQLNKELAKKMLSAYCFSDGNLRIGLNINLDSHQTNHANSKVPIKPNFPKFGVEIRYLNKNWKELGFLYARIIIQ